MLQLLNIEWLKIKNYTAFKVMSIFFLVAVVLVNYAVFAIQKNISVNTDVATLISFSPYNFDLTWQTTSYAAGYLLILPAMIMIMLVTNEYTFKTNRQNIIDGWSRSEFITVKICMALIAAIICTIIVAFTALCFGFASGTSVGFNGFSAIGYFFLKALSYNMFAILIAVLVKKTGFAIGLFFIYLAGENFAAQMLDLLSIKLRMNKIIDLGSLGSYLPLNASDGLLSFPNNPLKSLSEKAFPTDYMWVVFAFAIAYLCLFIWWSRRKYLTSDL